jgi:hypothetical protein
MANSSINSKMLPKHSKHSHKIAIASIAIHNAPKCTSALIGSQCAIPSTNSMKEHATSPIKVTTSHSNALNNSNFSQQTPKAMHFKTSLLEMDLHHMV